MIRPIFAAGCVAFAMLALVACGGGGSTSSPSSTGESAPASTNSEPQAVAEVEGPSTPELEKLGQEAAKEAGGKVTLPPVKIAWLNAITSTVGTKEINDDAEELAHRLGMEFTSMSYEGDPSKAASMATQLVNGDPTAMVTVGTDASIINQALESAKAKGIPVINIANESTATTLLAAQYFENTTRSEEDLDNQVIGKELKSGATIGVLKTPLLAGEKPRLQVLENNASKNGWEIVQSIPIDLSELEPGGTRAVNAILSAHPEISALWGDIGIYVPIMANAVKNRNECGKIKVYGHQAEPQYLAAMREGCVTALSVYPFQNVDTYAALDQIAEFAARKEGITEIPATIEDLYQLYGGLKFDETKIVTQANVPKAGEEVEPAVNYPVFFDAKWKAEFGK